MSQRGLDQRRPLDLCTSQLHRWRPFDPSSTVQTLEVPVDISNLSLLDHDSRPLAAASCKRTNHQQHFLRWVPRKRRRKSRSVSSDCSVTRRCCSIGATCSDIPMAATGMATDSSGELFFSGESHWGNDVGDGKGAEKDVLGFGQRGDFEGLGNESGYGSEPGYRGDAEFGYGDEVEEDEDDQKPLFWDKRAEVFAAEEKTLSEQKVHYRGRRKKHDWKLVDMMMG